MPGIILVARTWTFSVAIIRWKPIANFGEFLVLGPVTSHRWIPTQMASNAENVSIWLRHHDIIHALYEQHCFSCNNWCISLFSQMSPSHYQNRWMNDICGLCTLLTTGEEYFFGGCELGIFVRLVWFLRVLGIIHSLVPGGFQFNLGM